MSAALPIWAAVPVKDLSRAKQRLAPALSPTLRSALARAMLEDVLSSLAAARGLAGILVVTRDRDARRIAARYRAQSSDEAADEGHTAAVTRAARRFAAQGAAMLTLPGDVPLVAAAEIERMIAAHREGSRFVIAPARDRCGSNAILCAPAAAVPLRFGDDSFLPHLAAARTCGIEPEILPLPGIGLDIDTPDDLAAFLALPSQCRARRLLDRVGVRAA